MYLIHHMCMCIVKRTNIANLGVYVGWQRRVYRVEGMYVDSHRGRNVEERVEQFQEIN